MDSGVYVIRCVFGGEEYIGSSCELRRRWGAHQAQLRGRKHSNWFMQALWDFYGEGSFTFTVLEICATEDLLRKEQKWICVLRPELNICPFAGAPARGRKHSDDVKKKFGKPGERNPFYGRKHTSEVITFLRLKELGKKRSQEQKERMKLAARAATSRPEYRAKMSASIKAWWANRLHSKNNPQQSLLQFQ